MMNFTKTLSAFAAVATLACASANATPINLVVNGDFEMMANNKIGQIDSKTTATGWKSGGYNFVFNGATAASVGAVGDSGTVKLWGPASGSNNGLTSSPTGGNFLAADGAYGVAPITQMINGLVIGQQYDLSFYWAGAQQSGYNGANTENWTATLGNQGFTTATYKNNSHGFSGWMQQTFTYTATSTSELLSFLATGTPSGVPPFSLLDGVSLTAKVPEPSSVALLLAGLAMLTIGARARRRSGK